jgi:hypothetical protein
MFTIFLYDLKRLVLCLNPKLLRINKESLLFIGTFCTFVLLTLYVEHLLRPGKEKNLRNGFLNEVEVKTSSINLERIFKQLHEFYIQRSSN